MILPLGRTPTLELGARLVDGGARFRAFTTTAKSCGLRLFDGEGHAIATHAMQPAPDLGPGMFEAFVPGALEGALYKLVLDDRELPDPYARFLPDGVHGPARIERARHTWRFEAPVRPLAEMVVYELHVGTFTEEGTYAAATERLRDLVDLGVTAVELMPLAAAAGHRGWGYDGVAAFAPFAPYGSRDDLARFVDEAHGLGLSVLLDVVYNHFGPSGNYLSAYSPDYFHHDRKNAWGDAPDYAHPAMRALVLESARMWLEEMRFDGLRLDATHAIVDTSEVHILAELAETVKSLTPPRILVAEDDRNEPALVTKLGLDAIWADDFHHEVHVTLTGERDGYYGAYEGGAAGIARAIDRGWVFEGQPYAAHDDAPRGKPADDLAAPSFVYCVQNHDQVGNRAFGERITAGTSIDRYCAASVLLLSLPMTPLLFMGQEWAASTPFLYFTDHDEELGKLVSAGRREEFKRFAAFTDPAVRERIPDPQAEETFLRSKLDWAERETGDHARVLALYRAMLRLRKTDPVLRSDGREGLRATAQGNVLIVERSVASDMRVVLVNFGDEAVDLPSLPLPATDVRLLFASGRASTTSVLPPETALVLALRAF